MRRKGYLRGPLAAHRRSGLTLLELMIVLMILVGLIALVGPRLLGSQQKADIRTAEAQVGNLRQALKMYYVDMKSYPSTEEGLMVLLEPPEDERLARRWAGPYIDGNSLPLDPWGMDFQYEYEPDDEMSLEPIIFSAGPDGQPGTDDDIGRLTEEDQDGERQSRDGGRS